MNITKPRKPPEGKYDLRCRKGSLCAIWGLFVSLVDEKIN